MSALTLERLEGRSLFGCKGPRSPEWLAAQGVAVPPRPNSCTRQGGLGVARLGASEFFIDEDAPGSAIARIAAAHAGGGATGGPAGVYPVLREDMAFALDGAEAGQVLAQVCNVDFAALDLAADPVIMTLMIGVAVLVVPQATAAGTAYRIWVDPTYGPYLGSSLQGVVADCGGTTRGSKA